MRIRRHVSSSLLHMRGWLGGTDCNSSFILGLKLEQACRGEPHSYKERHSPPGWTELLKGRAQPPSPFTCSCYCCCCCCQDHEVKPDLPLRKYCERKWKSLSSYSIFLKKETTTLNATILPLSSHGSTMQTTIQPSHVVRSTSSPHVSICGNKKISPRML